MSIDLLGGILLDLSLVFKPKFDVLAGVCYSVVVVMDAVVIIAAIVLNPRAKRRREAERAAQLEAEQAAEGAVARGPESLAEQESRRTSRTLTALPPVEVKEGTEEKV